MKLFTAFVVLAIASFVVELEHCSSAVRSSIVMPWVFVKDANRTGLTLTMPSFIGEA